MKSMPPGQSLTCHLYQMVDISTRDTAVINASNSICSLTSHTSLEEDTIHMYDNTFVMAHMMSVAHLQVNPYQPVLSAVVHAWWSHAHCSLALTLSLFSHTTRLTATVQLLLSARWRQERAAQTPNVFYFLIGEYSGIIFMQATLSHTPTSTKANVFLASRLKIKTSIY